MAGRISKRTVDTLEVTGREYVFWDSNLPGFGVRVRENGAKSYIVQYRAGAGRGAPVRKLTLGAVGKLTPDEARKIAKGKLAEIAQGADPAMERAEERSGLTVSALIGLFLSDHVETKRKASTAAFYRLILKTFVEPELGKLRAAAVTTSAIAKLHLKMKSRERKGAGKALRRKPHYGAEVAQSRDYGGRQDGPKRGPLDRAQAG